VSTARTGQAGPKVVALGGGHGLFTSLSALRQITGELTAVVTVADDGGSSGRIRRELGVLPPGDLRMALVALAGRPGEGNGEGNGAGRAGATDGGWHPDWADILQHRFGGSGALAGHPVGNLLLTGLLEEHGDPVAALSAAAAMIGAVGRVLPMSTHPLDLVADVVSVERDDPVRTRRIRGQSAIAATLGQVRDIALVPADAAVCPQAADAIRRADAVVLGPGSWFTSVIPHLLLPELCAALTETAARVVVALNLVPQAGETDGFSATEHLRTLRRYGPDLHVDAVIADRDSVPDTDELARYCADAGALLVLESVVATSAADRHDPDRLAAAFARAITPGRTESAHPTRDEA
jgi:uncharacterized cofD-like protein